jgi:hypothetical protein
MDPLLIIALTPGIPEEGVRALAETLPKGSKALQALACRPDLTEPVAELLHKRVTGKARAATVRHITLSVYANSSRKATFALLFAPTRTHR